MDGDRRGAALRGRPSAQFKRKGGSTKKGRWSGSRGEPHENTQIPNPTDTVFRILCPSKKIGSVIGKGGGIIKVLREETQSKITVSDTIPGSDERVIMVYSPPEKSLESDHGNEEVSMPTHCPAQEALMRVHDRIIEDELLAVKEEGDQVNIAVTARLLVPNSLVGCLLGKGGDVIQRLRTETGASIRVLPSEQLPTCALSTDELVQIQGKLMVAKKALYEVSTLLHQNPRKEKALNYAMPSRGPGYLPPVPPVINMPLVHDPRWSPRHHSPHMPPPPPWMEDFERHRVYTPGRYDDDLPRPGMEPSGEFSLKLLCLASKIGGLIGKGGTNVRQLLQETGTTIHVAEPASRSSEERIIHVSAFETLATPRSQTIDAVLLLQNKASEISDKGVITTKLLVPSNKVGCLLGQGGTIINEMRRRTHADIRVSSKNEKPDCASEDEELVTVSGSFGVAKDALTEIASRLRVRCLKDASVEAESAPPRPVQSYGPPRSFSRAGPPVPGPIRYGPSGGYDAVKGGMHGYESPSYSVPPSASRYPNPNSSGEARYQNSVGTGPGEGRSAYGSNPEASGMGMKARDPYLGGPDSRADIRGSSDLSGVHHNYNGQNVPHQSSYNPKGEGPYHSTSSQQAAYPSPYQNHHQAPYQNHQQTPYPNHQQTPYESHHQTPYESHRQTPYENHHQAPYESHHQAPYENHHQTPYQQTNAQPSSYQSVTAHGGYQY